MTATAAPQAPQLPPRPTSNKPPPRPKLRLEIRDLRHPGAGAFLRLLPDVEQVFNNALSFIVASLYTPSASVPGLHFTPSLPPTRSVTLILHDFNGVAYTNGTELDNDHKEIHFSLSYIDRTARTHPAPAEELKGVITHELVHCYQHTGSPRPPGGLIEGIADFVRLRAGLAARHWKRPATSGQRADKWDAGYQNTAYFLEWIENVRIGEGANGLLNDTLRRKGYTDGFWRELFGVSVGQLWNEYGLWLDNKLVKR
ncbi:hypothetical protein VTN49DRAFT_851 [Thermomyces lanuginosus]|uniref:uncharacterized protein n=1 Tax=Thermomyces lanuginosus TaxID=5541 RepID=UPI00374407CC